MFSSMRVIERNQLVEAVMSDIPVFMNSAQLRTYIIVLATRLGLSIDIPLQSEAIIWLQNAIRYSNLIDRNKVHASFCVASDRVLIVPIPFNVDVLSFSQSQTLLQRIEVLLELTMYDKKDIFTNIPKAFLGSIESVNFGTPLVVKFTPVLNLDTMATYLENSFGDAWRNFDPFSNAYYFFQRINEFNRQMRLRSIKLQSNYCFRINVFKRSKERFLELLIFNSNDELIDFLEKEG